MNSVTYRGWTIEYSGSGSDRSWDYTVYDPDSNLHSEGHVTGTLDQMLNDIKEMIDVIEQ